MNDPSISSPDRLHPSVYGAYLAGLVIFEQVSGIHVTTLGGGEVAAGKLGIASGLAALLQRVASEAVANENPAPIHPSVDPCTLTQ